jgi:hypothetical protein
LLVPHQGGVGLGAKVYAARLGDLGAPPLELLLHADPSLVQHMVHSSLKGSLALVQRLLVPGQLTGGLADHCLPALEGISLPVEPIFEGMELLLSEAELPLALTSLCFSDGEPSLLQAQALRPGISTLLMGMEEGLSVLDFVQPLLGIGQEAVGIGPGLVLEVLSYPLGLLPSQGWVGRPDGGGGIFWRASEMISMAS